MAPMTPATPRDMPLPDEDLLEDWAPVEEAVSAEAQTPELLPQALHQEAWSPMEILPISETKVFQGRGLCCWPNRGYSERGLAAAVPLANRKRT